MARWHGLLFPMLVVAACGKSADEARDPFDPRTPALVFRLEEGDPTRLDAAVEIVADRLKVAGLGQLEVGRGQETLFVQAPGTDEQAEQVRALVERRGGLVLHLTVETSDPGYAYYAEQLKSALDAGNSPARDVPPGRRSAADIAAQRYPFGLRWYPLSEGGRMTYEASRLPPGGAPWILCRMDELRVSGETIENVRYVRDPNTLDGDWIVTAGIRTDARERWTRLTAKEGTYLAIIVGDAVHWAPRVLAPLSAHFQISGAFDEAGARNLAGLISSRPLPCVLRFDGRR